MQRWMQERGARLVKGKGNTFERTCGGGVVASQIDFAVEGGGAHLGSLGVVWGLSDHSEIGGVVQVASLEGLLDFREAVDWDAVVLTVADEDERWYGDLIGDSAYERMMDFWRRHLKRIRICSQSKP